MITIVFVPLLFQCIGTDVVDELIGPDLSRVEIEETNISLLVNEEHQISATYYDYSGNASSVVIEYLSRDNNIADVDQNGTVTGIDRGKPGL